MAIKPINTEYPTFIIKIWNTDRKVIFQDLEAIEQALADDGEREVYVDTDSLKQLNRFDRFVNLKHTPAWLLEFLYKDSRRRAQSLTRRLNEM